jgi:hypothetical protein
MQATPRTVTHVLCAHTPQRHRAVYTYRFVASTIMKFREASPVLYNTALSALRCTNPSARV